MSINVREGNGTKGETAAGEDKCHVNPLLVQLGINDGELLTLLPAFFCINRISGGLGFRV